MHFWINKGSQGVGLNGRYVHPSIFAGTRRPKSMVTPVHRFQSIESVASGGHRHPRPPVSHARFPVPVSIHIQNSIAAGQATNLGTSGGRTNAGVRGCANGRASQPVVGLATATTLIPTENGHPPASKLKCFVWTIIILIPFFIIGANYTNGVSTHGYLAYCGIFLLVLLIGGFVSLFELIGTSNHTRPDSDQLIPAPLLRNLDIEEIRQLDDFEYMSHHSREMEASEFGSVRIDPSEPIEDEVPKLHPEPPPPPYNIAIMIPSHNERLNGMQDSPPPTYEKAIN